MKKQRFVLGGVFLLGGVMTTVHPLSSEEPLYGRQEPATQRSRVLVSRELNMQDTKALKAVLVEVNYGPGEASKPHSHPCAVIGYIISGAVRSQVQGEPETIYQPGQTFYEPPHGVHLVSENASRTQPARLLAYMICDQGGPLSVDLPEPTHQKGPAQ
jgi:quercetin dioxygenase-like cupin family protein